MRVQIKVKKTESSKLNSFNPQQISFGKVFTDHMLVCDYQNGAWQTPEIVPFSNISVSPALSSLHYGQSIFEGMKAYKNEQGTVTLFRPLENAKRLNASALRMCMPSFPEDLFIQCLEEFVALESDWIPTEKGSSLYLRPFMFATDEYLGIKPSDNYKFMLYACPVGAYYSEPVKVYIEPHYVRAVKGGVGAAKCAGNYAASLYPAKIAREKGFDQILWTDAFTHHFIEETGTSNVFVKVGNQIYTPPLSDSILPGITRDSVITLLEDWNYEVIQENISVNQLIQWHQDGVLEEMFVSGTAATVMNIQLFGYQDQKYKLNLDSDLLAPQIVSHFYNLKTRACEDPFGWVHPLQLNTTLAESL